jgi:hypothetical protein
MRPGTVHAVVTIEDCLAMGGHFYSAANYIDTLKAIIVEKHIGNKLANTQHVRSSLALFKSLQWWSERPGLRLPICCSYSYLIMP